jgi:phosphatidylglycerol---prolipoprotein diacylglyceryl transferase
MPFLVLPFPSIDPIAIAIGPFAVRWYALAYIAGIILGWLYARSLLRNEKLWGGPAPISIPQFDDYVLWVTLGIILGGRAGYVLFYYPHLFIEHPLEVFQLWHGGMSFHGGFLGCVAAVLLFGWRNKVPVLSLGDVTCAVGTIGLLLGRLANFINGELWGRKTDVPWAFVFPAADREPRHPSQLYESALEGIVLFIVLTIMIRRGALKRPGLVIGVFAIGYGLARIFIEFFREPDKDVEVLWGWLTRGMLLSLPMIAAGLGFVLWAMRRRPTGEAVHQEP